MKLVANWVSLCVILAVFVAACADPPQYSNTPEIIFDNIIFRDVADPSAVDSLIISVRFKDGDGDLGLDATETGSPYHDKTYYRFANGVYVTYKTKRTVAGFDTLPPFVHPYNCINWEIKTLNNVVDTF